MKKKLQVQKPEKQSHGCCKNRSVLEKCLLVVLLLVISVIVTLFVVLILTAGQRTCDTSECLAEATRILSYLDTKRRPCNDFYQYVCTKQPTNDSQMDARVLSIEDIIEDIIKEPLNQEDSSVLKNQKLFYKSCMNLSKIDFDGDRTLMEIIESLGGWPVTKSKLWPERYGSWTDIVLAFKEKGLRFDWFLKFDIYPDYNNTNLYLLKIDVPSNESFFSNSTSYIDLMQNVVHLLGASRETSFNEVLRIVDFEQTLFKEGRCFQNESNEHGNIVPIRMLQEITPQIKWLDFINKLANVNFKETDLVMLNCHNFLKRLNRLLQKNQRITVDFMMWRTVVDLAPYLSERIRRQFRYYELKLYGKNTYHSRYEFCFDDVKKRFPNVAEATLIKRYMDDQKRIKIQELTGDTKKSLIKKINDSDWIDEESKKVSIDRIKSLQEIVAGTEEFYRKHDTNDVKFYFSSTNIVNMVTEYNIIKSDEILRQIYVQIAPKSPEGNLIKTRTISYDEDSNTLVIPLLEIERLYSPSRPNFINYATLATSVAHEILHGFSSGGWWSQTTHQAAYNKSRCLEKQYERFHSSKEFINKTAIIQEIMSNFLATEVSYGAYSEWTRKHGVEYMISGLDLSPNQIFWIEASRVKCSSTHLHQMDDLFSLTFRVVAPLKNSKYFAKDFYCEEGGYMNQKIKCQIL